MIYAPGQSADYVYHLHEGVAAITTTASTGEERTAMLIIPPQFIGMTALTNMQSNKRTLFLAEARAITPVTYCKIKKEAFWEMLDDRNLRAAFFNSIGSLMLDMSLLTASPLKDAISKRIYYVLKMLGRGIGHKCETGTIAIKGLSHEEIAVIANTSRSTVTRVLKEMEAEGNIEVHNRQIIIKRNTNSPLANTLV